MIILFTSKGILFSQIDNNSPKTKVNTLVNNARLLKDRLTIIPSSVSIIYKDSLYLEQNAFYIENSTIFLHKESLQKYKNDSLTVYYNTLDIDLGKYYFHLDSNALKKTEKAIYIGYDMGKNQNKQNALLPSSLDYDGSFSRGFSIGNRQSLVLNSNLNLQMAGKIGGGIEIKAAISDANIPIQPEGTTQQLNEFDKVFIEISKDNHSLVAGDYELKNSPGYFSRYFKKLKGVKYSNLISLKNKKTLKNSASFAISKGKFSRNSLQTVNGNQGPYKLQGSGGERFLIVLSGSEKVYLDGKLLVRGRDNDYVVDYNLAEITFTPSIMITENSRVIVEFEYSDQNYLRSLQGISSSYGDSTKNFYFDFFNEMDGKTSLGVIDLDSLDKITLSESGDDKTLNIRSGVRPIDEENISIEKNYYKKVYNSSILDSILVYTSNIDSAQYIAYFSDVGENSGSYNQVDSINSNVRVYEWVGFGLGRYEPVIQLIPPEKKQLLSFGTNYRLGKNTDVKAEMSISNIDENRFSTVDDADNQGLAGFVQFNTGRKIKIKKKLLKISNSTKYEYVGNNYSPINPYRSPEFSRDWNLSQVTSTANENIIANQFNLEISNIKANYNYSGLFRSEDYRGNKHELSLKYNYKGFSIYALGNVLKSKDSLVYGNFVRPTVNVSQRIGFLNDAKIGFLFRNENNEIKSNFSDSLKSNSFYNNYYKLYFDTKTNSKANLKLFFAYRTDFLPINNSFEEYTNAPEIGMQGNWKVRKISTLKYNISFRQLNVNTELSSLKKPESNILGKLQHTLSLLKGGFNSNTNIEFGSGQQAKSEFVYVKVKPGEGQYIWIDDNKDKVEQRDEFVLNSGPDTANYVLVNQYNSEFERVNSTLLNNTLRINGNKFFKKKTKRHQKVISKLSFYSIFKLLQKTKSFEGGYYFPVITDINDTSLLNYNVNYTGTLFYNRGNSGYDVHVGYKNISNHIFQVGGYIENSIEEYFSALRINYKSYIDLISKVSYGFKGYEYELSTNKDYLFKYLSVGQELNVFFNRKYGIKFNYIYSDKQNQIGEKQTAILHDLKVTGNILKIKNTKIRTSFSYVNISYSGGTSSLIELAMLDGLKDGNNYIWSLKVNKRMKNNLDLIIQYDGRKTHGSNVIHQGKMQARATF